MSGASRRITVATVVYNGGAQIEETLRSVVEQDHPNVQCVVIDGASTDDTVERVRMFGAAVHVLVSEPDQGIYDAMNKAVAHASGDYLLFMNCGDRFAGRDALSTLLRHVDAARPCAVFGAWERRCTDGATSVCRPDLNQGFFNHQSVLYSRSLHASHGPYVNVRGFTTADYLFFATLMASNTVPCFTVDKVISTIDVGGISSGPQTLSQKMAIDYLCGRTGRLKLAAVLTLHPLYRRVKSMLKARH